MRGEPTIGLRRDSLRQVGPGPAVKAMINEEDAPLLSALKAKRRALAEAARVPAYIIFTDRTLFEMAETRPETLDKMAAIGGVGAKKLDSYGTAFLQVINGDEKPLHPQRRKLAGREAGTTYGRLMQVQAGLTHGTTGQDKPMSCSASLVAKVAALHRPNHNALLEILVRGGLNDLPAHFWTFYNRRANLAPLQKEMIMLVVVSPAKKLNMTPTEGVTATEPAFAKNAQELARVARQLSLNALQKLMGLSVNLAQLNADRFAAFGSQDTKAAALAFAGDTYQGLEAATLDGDEMIWAQDHLRILSGLYGLLRPLDAIEPYRLEMGSRLKTAKGASLYAYWGGQLSEVLNAQAAKTGAKALVNCASQEYFGALDLARLTPQVINPVFMERKAGQAKIISFYAKKARGAMARYIVQHRLTDPEGLKDFDSGGYAYQPDQSDAKKWLFLRDYPEA